MGGKSFPGRAVVRLQQATTQKAEPQKRKRRRDWKARRKSKDRNLEMDMEFWASRVQSAKHHSAMQSARRRAEAHLSMDDVEGDDDVYSYFPCPFCYMDIEVPVLHVHLQEEHCFDVKNSVCPVCAGTLGKDMIVHFTVQHSHLLKRRRKSQRTGFWSNSSTASMLAKDLHELTSFFGVVSTNGMSDCSLLMLHISCLISMVLILQMRRTAKMQALALTRPLMQLLKSRKGSRLHLMEHKSRLMKNCNKEQSLFSTCYFQPSSNLLVSGSNACQ